ncbi:hypothetical protein QOT17_008524 [Balamuthia mandrillaris]
MQNASTKIATTFQKSTGGYPSFSMLKSATRAAVAQQQQPSHAPATAAANTNAANALLSSLDNAIANNNNSNPANRLSAFDNKQHQQQIQRWEDVTLHNSPSYLRRASSSSEGLEAMLINYNTNNAQQQQPPQKRQEATRKEMEAVEEVLMAVEEDEEEQRIQRELERTLMHKKKRRRNSFRASSRRNSRELQQRPQQPEQDQPPQRSVSVPIKQHKERALFSYATPLETPLRPTRSFTDEEYDLFLRGMLIL